MYWLALAPLLYLIGFRRGAPARYWLVALGFAASWFADAGAAMLGGSWALSYVLPGVQLGLFAWALGYWLAMPAMLVALGAETLAMTAPVPETAVTILGSMAVVWWARETDLGLTLAVYCGLGTALYVLLAIDVWGAAFTPLWYAYQGARLVAFGLFGRAAWTAA